MCSSDLHRHGALSKRRTRELCGAYLMAEKAVGSMNANTGGFARMGPLASEAVRAVTHSGSLRNASQFRAHNMVKHVCVAARIGDGKAPSEGNSRSIAKTSNAAIADSGCNPFGLARVLAHGVVERSLA